MLNVMIVDDSIIIQKTLTKLFKEIGHNVVAVASNGIDAIELYEQTKPDLITLDISMPEMSGIEVLKELKLKNANLNVLMITSNGEQKLVIDALAHGAKGYIIKPINKEKIKNTINKIFTNNRLFIT